MHKAFDSAGSTTTDENDSNVIGPEYLIFFSASKNVLKSTLPEPR
jgi:hypothetical protein